MKKILENLTIWYYTYGRSLIIWGWTGFDWLKKIICARQRAAWLCKNAETIIANDNVDFDYALAA